MKSVTCQNQLNCPFKLIHYGPLFKHILSKAVRSQILFPLMVMVHLLLSCIQSISRLQQLSVLKYARKKTNIKC